MSKTKHDEFHDAMMKNYEEANKIKSGNFTRFKKMLDEYRGVETARKLVRNSMPSVGFTKLWENDKLNLSAEFLVMETEKNEWIELFSNEERAMAKKKLKEYNFFKKEINK